MTDRPPPIDKHRARRAFSRAADTYDEAAVLQREIGERMLERLDYVKLAPEVILDAGCGTGTGAEALLRRYRKARVVAMDFAYPMLRRARRRGSWLRRPISISKPCSRPSTNYGSGAWCANKADLDTTLHTTSCARLPMLA